MSLTLQSKKVDKFFQTVIQQNEQMSPKSNALIFSERELLIELHGTRSSQSLVKNTLQDTSKINFPAE